MNFSRYSLFASSPSHVLCASRANPTTLLMIPGWYAFLEASLNRDSARAKELFYKEVWFG